LPTLLVFLSIVAIGIIIFIYLHKKSSSRGGSTNISTQCKNNCSLRGLCVNGKCNCNPGYTGSECQYDMSQCNGNGSVVNSTQCTCNTGYGPSTGTKNLCKFWIPGACGTGPGVQGIDENGKCICNPGFTGDKCNNINGPTFPFNGTRKWYIPANSSIGSPPQQLYLCIDTDGQPIFTITGNRAFSNREWYIVPAKTKKNLYSLLNVNTGTCLWNNNNPPGGENVLTHAKITLPTDNEQYLFSFVWRGPTIFNMYNQGYDVFSSLPYDPCFPQGINWTAVGVDSKAWDDQCPPEGINHQDTYFIIPVD